jgi:hypothetical protein
VLVVLWTGDWETAVALTEVADSFASGTTDIALTILQTEENTVSAKENAGISVANGDLVCFMDDDAVARPDWLARIEAHYGNPTVGAVGGRDVVWNGVPPREVDEIGRLYWFGRLVGNHHERSTGVRDVHFLKGCNMSFRREALVPVDAGLIGEVPYGYEIGLGLAVRTRGLRVIYDPEIIVDHYPSVNVSATAIDPSFVSNHNQVYLLLQFLPWPQKIVFLAYTFMIGDKNSIGLLRVPQLLVTDGYRISIFRAHFAGKVRGIESYLSWLTNSPWSIRI